MFAARPVKSFPTLSAGFELETGQTVHPAALLLPQGEVPSRFKDCPDGLHRGPHTFQNGFGVPWETVRALARERPAPFCSSWCIVLVAMSFFLGAPLVGRHGPLAAKKQKDTLV